MNSKLVLTYAALLYGIFGAGWLIAPDALGKFWAIAPGDNFTYMGHRYGAFMLGLPVAAWLARGMPNTPARRALMIGALVALALKEKPGADVEETRRRREEAISLEGLLFEA